MAAPFHAACNGQQAEAPAYTPQPLDRGVIRSWGDGAMRETMLRWEQAFRKYHPEITFEDTLYGTGTGMAGIITGVSDLSLMGRPVTANEVIGFEWVHGVKPLGIRVMTGGLSGEGKTPSLAVFVSANNPVSEMSMTKLATILGCPKDPRIAPTWSLAGASGKWADMPIHAYLFDSSTGSGAFLQQAVLGSADCWNWSIVHEFKDTTRADGSLYSASEQIADALRHDPAGLAVATLAQARPGIKALALSRDGDAIYPTLSRFIDASYPLTRGVYIYIHRAKDKPVDAKVAEFLRFILSAEGQAQVQAQGDYLPLGPAVDLDALNSLQ